MPTFAMFGKYSLEAIKHISAARTEETRKLAEKYQGKITAMYALLGEHDLLFLVDMPGPESAMQFSVALAKATGISFTTSPAVTVEEFDRLMTGI